jgi:hypothetical protein
MTKSGTDLHLREAAVAHRLRRLFTAERANGFDRQPAATTWRIIERRGAMIEELQKLDDLRRALSLSRSIQLDRALRELAQEVSRASKDATRRLEQIGEDLRVRRREGASTGIRGSSDGRLLGRS